VLALRCGGQDVLAGDHQQQHPLNSLIEKFQSRKNTAKKEKKEEDTTLKALPAIPSA
jgi:hypothetical protein